MNDKWSERALVDLENLARSQAQYARIDKLAHALRNLLEQVESLDDYTLTRDVEPYKAQANWDAAIRDAHEVLG